MHYLFSLVDFILHIDVHLDGLIGTYGNWTYAVLFAIIFCETGLVVTPFLPGDSLLFAAGAFAARGSLNLATLTGLLAVAAIAGDAINYTIGALIGPRVFEWKTSRIFKPEYLERTHQFYERYGGKAIIFARFVPIVRTFIPFLAGVGSMSYRKFALYNITGGILWIALMLLSGYFLGGFDVVKKNFSIVVLAIIFISVLPAVIEAIKVKRSGVPAL